MDDQARLIQLADNLRDQRRFADAHDAYLTVLRQAPADSYAVYQAGICLAYLGRNADAVRWLRQATVADPANAQAHADLGAVLSLLGNAAETVADTLASLDRAIALRPDHASALANRAKVLNELGRYREALDDCDRALAAQPEHQAALTNRGNAMLALRRHAEALADYDRVLAQQPDYPTGHYNRGSALNGLRRFEEALINFDRALVLRPNWPQAWNNRGFALSGLRRYAEAMACNERALALQPDYVDAMNNNGHILRELKRPEEALAWFDRALTLRPDDRRARFNRGAALLDMKRLAAAATDFAALPEGDADVIDAAGYLLQARTHACDWTGIDRLRARITSAAAAGRAASHPFPFLGVAGDPRAERDVARSFATARFTARTGPVWRGEHYAHQKIRLGYLSADFHGHATAYLMAELFETHDRDRFELTALSFGPNSTAPMRTRLQHAFDHFIDVGALSDMDTARLIRAREIDILVDLKGITTDARPGIAALRPAPIQVGYLGYPGTLGAPFLDYIIADPVVIPPEHHTHYSECVVTLPDTYQVNDSKRPIATRTPTRTELRLPEQGFVFCCFNNSYKILPDIFAVWMRLLNAVPGSVLWLFEDNAEAVANLRRAALAHGIAAERLVFAAWMEPPQHLARQRQADLFLDTLPYNAHTTASDALWAGLPVLTCLGASFPGRVAAGLLAAIDLPELITHSLAEYEALALRLARDPAALAAIRARLHVNRDSARLFDTSRYSRHLETAYTEMWQRHQRGEPPESFAVPPLTA